MDEAKKQNPLAELLRYAGELKPLTYIGCGLSALAMFLGMAPYVCIWLAARDLIAAAPNWREAADIALYGWLAFGFAVAGIVLYFAGLMCTHLAAFRAAANIRKRGMARLMQAPLGFFDRNASGLIRNRLHGAAAETETLLAHNLADIAGTLAMFAAMLILMFVFDWRMGAACLLAALISFAAQFAMMGGGSATYIQEYQAAQDRINRAGTEYVRGIPVVKVFQQTVHAFTDFKAAIEDYSRKAEHFQAKVCRLPQAINLTFTEGAFVFLVPLAIFLAPRALAAGDLAGFVTDFAFYAVFSAVTATALLRIMFAAGGLMQASAALDRIRLVTEAPVLPVSENPRTPEGDRVEFDNVRFTYPGAAAPALDGLSFVAEPGRTLALVGPSGSGKTTAASLIPRFWDADQGTVRVGGVDVREIEPQALMNRVAFVFQNSRLFKTSILENVRAARPEATRAQVEAADTRPTGGQVITATRAQVEAALAAAQCADIIAKLPAGMDTVIGTKGTYLSGGERQRIALARAILKDAPILVLDEATAFADPENEALIQRAFAKLAEKRTVIMIAHRLSTVVRADRIVVLEAGRVMEQGAHADLVEAGGLYARMWADYNRAVRWKITTKTDEKTDENGEA